jgi:uncharacterized protein YeaO (DUF488 family)
MIKTACASDFYKKKPGYTRPPDSGTVILITRGRPYPWLDYDEWKQVLGPRYDTLNRWKTGEKTERDWKRYEKEFLPQMKEKQAVEAIEGLRQRTNKKSETITLLCYCPEGQHCHRHIIKSMIEEH